MYYQVWQASNSGWYWRVKTGEHKELARSTDGYKNKEDCYDAMRLVMKTTVDTAVLEDNPATPIEWGDIQW